MLEGVFVGRAEELQRLREFVVAVAAGVGCSVLIEGESGIGESALLVEVLAAAERLGCAVRWTSAEEWGHRFPLQVLVECLGLDARVQDPAPTAALADPVLVGTERALALVDHLCSDAPLVVAIDLQWADDACDPAGPLRRSLSCARPWVPKQSRPSGGPA